MATIDIPLAVELLLVLVVMLTLEAPPPSQAAQGRPPEPAPNAVRAVDLPSVPAIEPPRCLPGQAASSTLPSTWTAETDLHAQRILRLERRRPGGPESMAPSRETRGAGVASTTTI